MKGRKNSIPLTRGGCYRRSQKKRKFLRYEQGNKCGRCKKEINEANGRKYHIHHIDGNIYNNDISNLIILCPSCHMKTHQENGTYPKKYRCKIRDRFGYSSVEFIEAGISNYKNLKPWETIKDVPGAVYKGLGFGIVKNSKHINQEGHTLQEFADYFGISRQRVAQLIKNGSDRIAEARNVLDMRSKAC